MKKMGIIKKIISLSKPRLLAMTIMSVLVLSLLANFAVNTQNANAGRSPGDWLNQDFWDNYSNDGNIIYALYGDGTPGSSPYNKYWTGGCLPSTVSHVSSIPTTINANTIYVLASGSYNLSSSINMGQCSALIGEGENTIITTSSHGIFANTKSNIIVDNLKIQGNSSSDGVSLQNTTNSTINNVKIWGGIKGIRLVTSNHNMFNNVNIYNNLDYGIELDQSNFNYISNSQIYNQAGFGDAGVMTSESTNNIINNCNIYNNNIGLDNATSQMNSINNSQIYNNNTGIALGRHSFFVCTNGVGSDSGLVIHNSNIYNNKSGIYGRKCIAADTVIHYLSDVYLYNNNIGLSSINTDNRFFYYNNLNLFFNSHNIGGSVSLLMGSMQIMSWENGILISGSETMSKYWITNPVNSSGIKLINDFTNRSANRGTGTFLATSQPIKYVIGKNISKQIQPVRWVDTYPELFGSQIFDRDENDYIAAVNMELAAQDDLLIEYYYGSNSEFTENWDENNCSLGAFTVEHIDNYTELFSKMINTFPMGHTIYVLADGLYNMSTTTISINDSCIAIVNQGSGAELKRSVSSIANLINIYGEENIILDGVSLNGSQISKNGLSLELNVTEKSKNNTMNNIKAYNFVENGVKLGMSSEYNTIMNSQFWNNNKNGIEIYYAGDYNVINNSLAYNNTGYGVRFGNGSKYNTINNGQFFNNGIGGIFADFTTQQNIINNVHTYNNAMYGINFKRSSGNTLNDIYAYNNNIGININDTSCVNNVYNGDLSLFANTGGNLSGTDGLDNFLNTGSPAISSWDGGTMYLNETDMGCSWATNPRYVNLNTIWLLSGDLACAQTGKQSIWTSGITGGLVDYMFGLNISKQISPVGYSGTSIITLDNQYDNTKYIGEANPIITTYPGTVLIVPVSGSNNLNPNTIYELDVNYDTGMMNHNFDVKLTINTIGATGYVAVKTGINRINVGTGTTNLPFANTDIMLVITTLSGYNSTVSGSLFIGTDNYGGNTGNFSLATTPDPTPPTIIWSGNISTGGIWEGQSNTWQAIVTGFYTTNAWAKYVTGAVDCYYTTTGGFTSYTGTLQQVPYTIPNINGKYVCIYAEDTVNGQTITGLSNQIKISELEFVDDISAGPVYYDIIDINFQNLINYGYRRVNTGSECGTGLSGAIFTNYTSPIVLNSDTSYNGRYICAYGQDSTGSGRYLVSNNDINISNYGNTVNFSDDVEDHRVSSDTVSVYFSGAITFDQKKYKWVDTLADCSNTTSMVNYAGSITLTNDTLNGKYFCLYSHEQVSGIENYLISLNPVKIDIVSPTAPIIESPVDGEDVTFLIIETYGASDTQSGLSGFEYEIAKNSTFLDIITNGIYYTTGTRILPDFDEDANTYAIRVRAVDAAGNKSSRSTAMAFDYQALNNFEFENIEDAKVSEAYVSNKIIMDGLENNQTIWAEVTNGVLYRNGDPKGTGTLVQNDDEISIEMFSSDDYDKTVETELIIANRRIPWEITTMNKNDDLNCDLSNSQKLAVASIFNGILDTYTSDTELAMFLITMQSMLEDNIDLEADDEEACNMRYLLDLISNHLEDELGDFNTSIHIAPNCKEYNIEYSDAKGGYYSSNMTQRMYFASRDNLGKFIDSKNPGDCHINTYGDSSSYDNSDPNKHVAPNGKVYSIQSSDIGYTSTEFSNVKYFASIAELRSYIDRNNPAIIVWDHEVDAEFEPVIHIAPNGKDYKIYKTNRGYMSYKLLKVQYFGSLEELKSYIDRNNG